MQLNEEEKDDDDGEHEKPIHYTVYKYMYIKIHSLISVIKIQHYLCLL